MKPVEYDRFEDIHDGIALAVNKNVDILFVIDNSGSMGEEQGTLSSNFESFIGVLEDPDVEANYRIGITTTDNGNPWCAGTTPEGGALRLSSCQSRLEEFIFDGTDPPTDRTAACTDFCESSDIPITPTATETDPTPRPRPWMERNEETTNLPDGVDTTAAFQCFGPQGINGCGFESHLESMYKALARAENAEEESFGFLRKNAILSLIFVTDEADCSHQTQWADIFLPEGNRVFWSDPNAAVPTSAVCWNAGVECTGSGTYNECHAVDKDVDGNTGASEADAVLHPLRRYVDAVQIREDAKKSLNPIQEVIVAVIGGVPQGYVTGQDIAYQDTTDPGFQGDYGIGPGCSSAAGEAVPPVRLREFAEAFEIDDKRNLYSVCATDYSPPLKAIADTIRDRFQPACMQACVMDTDPSTPVLDPVCTLVEQIPTQEKPEVIPSCRLLCGGAPCAEGQDGRADGWEYPDGAAVCYRTLLDRTVSTPSPLDDMGMECRDEGWNLEFALERREPAVGGSEVIATCQRSAVPKADCPDL